MGIGRMSRGADIPEDVELAVAMAAAVLPDSSLGAIVIGGYEWTTVRGMRPEMEELLCVMVMLVAELHSGQESG